MTDAERRSYDGLAGVVRKGQLDGSIRADLDPTSVAVLVLGTIRGVAALVLTDSAIVSMASVRGTVRALVTSGLVGDGAGDDDRSS